MVFFGIEIKIISFVTKDKTVWGILLKTKFDFSNTIIFSSSALGTKCSENSKGKSSIVKLSSVFFPGELSCNLSPYEILDKFFFP